MRRPAHCKDCIEARRPRPGKTLPTNIDKPVWCLNKDRWVSAIWRACPDGAVRTGPMETQAAPPGYGQGLPRYEPAEREGEADK